MKYTIYGRKNCLHCENAVKLLDATDSHYEYRNVDEPDHMHTLKLLMPSAKTIPQIWCTDEHIGGFDELRERLTRG